MEHLKQQTTMSEIIDWTKEIEKLMKEPETCITRLSDGETFIISKHVATDDIEKYILELKNLDQDTLEWVLNTTPEERRELQRLSKIAYHKSQIKLLNQTQND